MHTNRKLAVTVISCEMPKKEEKKTNKLKKKNRKRRNKKQKKKKPSLETSSTEQIDTP